ncbi:MAG: ABC transporter permease [Clostridia bacterium]
MNKDGMLKNLMKNKEYITYYAKLLLKQKVAGSYLGVLWLFLDPLLFMLVYMVVIKFLFQSHVPNFHIYVFIGLTTFKLMSGTILMNTSAIVRNKSIFEQVYFHKFVYPTIYLLVNLYEFLIANTLIVILMLFANPGIPPSFHMLEFIPVTIIACLFTYGASLIIAHFGVYFFDLRNISDVVFKFLFYTSPIMWSYAQMSDKIPAAVLTILKLNPLSIIIESYRSVLFLEQSPNYSHLLGLTGVSVLLIIFGYQLISKNEDEYGKVI